MIWKTIERDNKVEVWVESKDPERTLLCRVTSGPGGLDLDAVKGYEVFGLDHSVFEKYSMSVITPAIEGRPWNCDSVLSALEDYLLAPEKYDALLTLMIDRIHLADGISNIDMRLSRVVTQFIGKLSIAPSGAGQLLIAAWSYNLVNALFVKAENMSGIEGWIRNQQLLFDNAFIEGLPILANLQPRIADYCALLLHLVNEMREGD